MVVGKSCHYPYQKIQAKKVGFICIIAYAPKGVDIPTTEQLKAMWDTNPDGAGYAYEDNSHHIVYKKGFMTLESLLKDLENPERFKNTNFAIHFRIGTSGKNDAPTCHPFPLSTTFGELRQTEGKAESVLFHNGILSQGKKANPLSSDTQDFVVAFAPLLRKYNKSKTRDFFMEELTKGSKVLILYKNNKTKMYGQWEKDGELYVSNTYYKWSSYQALKSYATAYDDDNADWYADYYKDYESSVINHAKTQQEKRDEADALFQYIIDEGYADLYKEDMRLVKEMADDYTREKIMYKGYTFGYLDQMVWLEEEPADKYQTKEQRAVYA